MNDLPASQILLLVDFYPTLSLSVLVLVLIAAAAAAAVVGPVVVCHANFAFEVLPVPEMVPIVLPVLLVFRLWQSADNNLFLVCVSEPFELHYYCFCFCFCVDYDVV